MSHEQLPGPGARLTHREHNEVRPLALWATLHGGRNDRAGVREVILLVGTVARLSDLTHGEAEVAAGHRCS